MLFFAFFTWLAIIIFGLTIAVKYDVILYKKNKKLIIVKWKKNVSDEELYRNFRKINSWELLLFTLGFWLGVLLVWA